MIETNTFSDWQDTLRCSGLASSWSYYGDPIRFDIIMLVVIIIIINIKIAYISIIIIIIIIIIISKRLESP